jgi:hypothetical protein
LLKGTNLTQKASFGSKQSSVWKKFCSLW